MAARAEPGDLKLSRPGYACSGDAVTQTQRRPLPRAFAGAAKRDSDVLCTTSEMSEASEGDPSGAPRPRRRLHGVDLAGQHLHGASYAGADLFGARLAGADLTGADLSDAPLVDVDLPQTPGHGRARVRADQTQPADRVVAAPRPIRGEIGMAADHGDAQPAELHKHHLALA